VDKGSINLGGVIGLTIQGGDLYENQNGDKRTIIDVNPSLLYFIMPNLAVGAELVYSSTSQGDAKETAMGIGPKVAYFVGNENSKAYPYLGFAFGYGTWKQEGGMEFEGTMMRLTPVAGAVFMVSKNVGINIEAFYQMDSSKLKDADESTKGNQMGVRIGVAGFIY